MEVVKYYCDACSREMKYSQIKKVSISNTWGEQGQVYDLCHDCAQKLEKMLKEIGQQTNLSRVDGSQPVIP